MKTISSIYFKSSTVIVFFIFLSGSVFADTSNRIDPEKEKNADKTSNKFQICKKKEVKRAKWWMMEISKLNPKNTSNKSNQSPKPQKKIQQEDLLMPFVFPSFLNY